jgi:N-acetyldiaminopimelate deacetylase
MKKQKQKRKLSKNFVNYNKKSVSRSPSAETRWRACEEAFAATAGPKRREALATGARQKKSVSRSPSAETRWRTCEEAFAATAGPKRREALATGARHGKLDSGFYTYFSYKENEGRGGTSTPIMYSGGRYMVENNLFVNIRRELHKIPELGFQEFKTQQLLLNYIHSLPQDHIEIKTWKTGIFVKVRGKNPRKMIGYRADIDGLPIEEQTGLLFSSQHNGKMHACGHDFHMSIALGILTHFVHHRVDDDLLFIFQPAEEGPGGALPMLKSEIMREWKPDIILALHIAPEYPVGTIATKKGLLFANTSELFIDLIGKAGHAARPHLANDMVVAACSLVTQLQSIVSRNVDPLDSAVITIGKITGGTVQNIIAERARLEGTIRTLSDESMKKVKERIEALVKGIEVGYQCEAVIDYGAMYHQVFNDETLTDEFMNYVDKQTDVQLIECKEAMTGEDFGYMLKDIPGFMFWLGVDSEFGLHHSKLNPNEKAIDVAIRLMTSYINWKASRN